MSLIERQLTGRQALFVEHYVAGLDQTNAARVAGYADPKGDGYRVVNLPHVQLAIQKEVVRRVHTEGLTIAFNTLINLLKSDKTPAGAKVDAARLILNKGPLNDKAVEGAYAGDKKPLAEMGLDELEAFISGGQKAIEEAKKKKAIPAEFTDVSAQPDALPAPK